MGCVRKRGNRYQAQVRRMGCQPVSKTFVYRQDAEKWVREIEPRFDRGQHHSIQPTTITLGFYYFCRCVPKALLAHYPKPHIVAALKTRKFRDALRQSQIISKRLYGQWFQMQLDAMGLAI